MDHDSKFSTAPESAPDGKFFQEAPSLSYRPSNRVELQENKNMYIAQTSLRLPIGIYIEHRRHIAYPRVQPTWWRLTRVRWCAFWLIGFVGSAWGGYNLYLTDYPGGLSLGKLHLYESRLAEHKKFTPGTDGILPLDPLENSSSNNNVKPILPATSKELQQVKLPTVSSLGPEKDSASFLLSVSEGLTQAQESTMRYKERNSLPGFALDMAAQQSVQSETTISQNLVAERLALSSLQGKFATSKLSHRAQVATLACDEAISAMQLCDMRKP